VTATYPEFITYHIKTNKRNLEVREERWEGRQMEGGHDGGEREEGKRKEKKKRNQDKEMEEKRQCEGE